MSSRLKTETYEKLVQNWQSYLNESKAMISLSEKNLRDEVMANMSWKSETLYGELIQTIDELLELNAKARDSDPSLWKALLSESRLAVYIFSIIGMTVILICVFNLFDRVTRIAILRKK